MFSCVIGQRSQKECGPNSAAFPLQTLNELDAAHMKLPGRALKVSWMILSRIGVNYLVAPHTFGSWTICFNHRKEFLDSWQVQPACCYPHHSSENAGSSANADEFQMVTLIMSVKLLQSENRVLPISGRMCSACKKLYETKYASKPGEKVVVVIPKAKTPAAAGSVPTMPSPFCKQEPLDESEVPQVIGARASASSVAPSALNSRLPAASAPVVPTTAAGPTPFSEAPVASMIGVQVQDATNPCLTLKTEVVDHTDITVKQEPPDPLPDDANNASNKRKRKASNKHYGNFDDDDDDDIDDVDSLFSDDSDDDRTWAPSGVGGSEGGGGGGRRLNSGSSGGTATSTTNTTTNTTTSRRKNKPAPAPPPHASPSSSDDDRSNAIDGGGADLHYYCRICQITFYKHTSYKMHMRSSKEKHRQIERKNEEQEEEFECSDCCIAFRDRIGQQRHLHEVHQSEAGSFYCAKCDVFMKNESAFKSHNSKLHLERREKTYYCRECDETFKCKRQHQVHIRMHRPWSGKDPGLQCTTCGKVFTSNQFIPYQRHMATHDTEPEDEYCACPDCAVDDDDDENPDNPNGGGRKRKKSKKKSPSKLLPADSGPKGLLKKMQSNFLLAGGAGSDGTNSEEGENVDDPDSAMDDDEDLSQELRSQRPFVCSMCPCRYATARKLESHVSEKHANVRKRAKTVQSGRRSSTNSMEENDVDLTEVEEVERKSNKLLQMPLRLVSKVTTVDGCSSPVTAKPPVAGERHWQECPDRNWAAEFGYGKTKAVNLANPILSEMKAKFKVEADEEEVDKPQDDDELKVYRTRGFRGTVKASPNKAPRTLSAASLLTRKRMERLMKRAREGTPRGKGSAKYKTSNEGKEASKNKEQNAPDTDNGANARDDEDDDVDVDVDVDVDDDSVLIPLSNEWVCEKKPDKSKSTAGKNIYSHRFWKPDGTLYESLRAVEEYARKHKLDVSVFRNAVKENTPPEKASEPAATHATNSNTRPTQRVPDMIIVPDSEEEEVVPAPDEVEDMIVTEDRRASQPTPRSGGSGASQPMVQIHDDSQELVTRPAIPLEDTIGLKIEFEASTD